jgi:YVTN family beta-propeller protein
LSIFIKICGKVMYLALNSNLIRVSLSIIFLLGLSSCTLVENPDDQLARENHYYETKEVADILNGTCAASGCHGGTSPVNGFSTETQPETMQGSSNRPLDGVSNYGGDNVIPFNVEKSLLLQFITGNLVNTLSFNHSILSQNQITTVANWIADGAQNYKEEVAFAAPNSYRVYACNQNSEYVSVIDGTEKVVSYLTDLYNPLTDSDSPYWVAEYGQYYYVTLSSAGQFVKLRKSDNSVVSVISGLSDAGVIKISRDGTKAYVSRTSTSSFFYSSIFVINLNFMTVKKEITFSNSGLLHGLALDRTRDYLYIADAYNNLVLVVNTLNDQIIDVRYSLTKDFQPYFLEVSLNGNYLYVTASNTDQLLVVSTNSRLVISTVKLLSEPMGVAVSSSGQKIFVASRGGDAVEVITKVSDSWSKTNTITHPTMSMPFGIDYHL